ncbi:hypothetical protein E2C01_001271 [Portunus trituberculatus]|uniref:Uncharacterized protein n=1 Tax=Portunus trituberculatus TaxID=210409 RepID=A0A5B7CGW2_PORTR|nr:hypothetical protein [Portunus trituberculatus]
MATLKTARVSPAACPYRCQDPGRPTPARKRPPLGKGPVRRLRAVPCDVSFLVSFRPTSITSSLPLLSYAKRHAPSDVITSSCLASFTQSVPYLAAFDSCLL